MFTDTFKSTTHRKIHLDRDQRFAIIDLGTNSIRCDIYEVRHPLQVDRVYREKVMVRMGDQVFLTKKLDAAAKLRVISTLKEFRAKLDKFKVDRTIALATSAVRSATDSRSFLRKVKAETEIRFQIISGELEAKLIAVGILNNETTPQGPYALVDIGGGSTEVSFCYKKTVLDSRSFEMGAIRAQQVFLKKNPPPSVGIRRLRKQIRALLPNDRLRWPPVPTVVGSSGTLRAIRRILRETGYSDEPFKAWLVSELIAEMEAMKTKEILKIPGMEPKRADIILAGAIIFDELLKALNAQEFSVTGFSLRDGILESQLQEILTL